MLPASPRATWALPRTRPPTPWLLIALEWVINQIGKAPRPMRMPLLYLVLMAAELLPVKLLQFRETLYDRLYSQPGRS